MILKARKKPVTIEAIQFTGSNFDEVRAFVGQEYFSVDSKRQLEIYEYKQGMWLKVNVGDYILKGIAEEVYPCTEEIFLKSYDIETDAAK